MLEEKRINRQLEHYWNERRGERAFPKESDIERSDIDALWPHLLLIELKADMRARGFFYSHMGRSLIEAYGADFSGREVVEKLLSAKADHMVQDVYQVEETKEPVLREGEFDNEKLLHVKFRRALFPLGDAESGHVTHVIGGMRWKLA